MLVTSDRVLERTTESNSNYREGIRMFTCQCFVSLPDKKKKKKKKITRIARLSRLVFLFSITITINKLIADGVRRVCLRLVAINVQYFLLQHL